MTLDGSNVTNIGGDEEDVSINSVDDDVIVEAFDALKKIDDEREDINARSQAIFADLKKQGLDTKAARAAYMRFKQDEDKRNHFDQVFAKCCKATGVGYQHGLFD